MSCPCTRVAALPLGIALAVASLGPRAAAQGETGFLRGAGKFDAALTYEHDEFDEFWVGTMDVKDPNVGTLERDTGSLWFAYGMNEDADVVLTAAWVSAETDGNVDFDDESALQDATLALKYRFVEERVGPGEFWLLAHPGVKIPMTHYEANDVTAIGDGQIDYRFRAIAHYQFDAGLYVAVESGFDYRTEGPGNEVPIHVTAGATLFDRVTISPFYSNVNSLDGIDIGQGDFPDVEEDYERWGIGLYARITDQFGVTAGYKDTIDGRNTGDLWGYWLGVVFGI